ncbi:NAD(P)-binding domain-containing protein [Streptomyces sp. DSM 44915]|uniref:NAD(P)-binding domain-containing protein n=1 Tax=Streptomyces chisholmiae TaxID=3075540 RepID=A0ABU2JX39_9ACTN|nr:NAD(P)-binding domain-containing protein [Streptomyces sp. DSM 44915]MDT0269561.1 NAD(P)-binding domain-containing protein [Streptomyces sp. DSM 44915]
MRIGVLGAGRMAEALGAHWVRAGHRLLVSGRDPARAETLAGRLGGGTAAGDFAAAARFGEVVLLAVRAEGALPVLAAAGAGDGALAGRTLIDCVNPVAAGFVLADGGGRSMAERVAAAAPGAWVVKGFNLCHEDVWRMTPPAFDGAPLAVPLCGDEPAALAVAGRLVRDLGCVPQAGGGLARAGLLEATAALVIGLWVGANEDARAMLPPLAYAAGPPDDTQPVPGSR